MKKFIITLSTLILFLFVFKNTTNAQCDPGEDITVVETQGVCGSFSNTATVEILVDIPEGCSILYQYGIMGFANGGQPINLGPQPDSEFSGLPAGNYVAQFYERRLVGGNPGGDLVIIKTKNFTVSLVDIIPPIARCKNVKVQLGDDGTFQDDTGLIDNGSWDNCSIPPGRPLINFDCSNLGPNTVTLSLTDEAGNTSTCTGIVTVEDNIQPEITCPNSKSVIAPTGRCSSTVSYSVPVGTDNCTATTTLTAGLGSGATFPVGVTRETYTVTDAAGNSASCSLTITVEDDEKPTLNCPTELVVEASDINGTIVDYSLSSNDNCGVVSDDVLGPVSGSLFPVGKTEITYSAEDAAGNSNSCSFSINVVLPIKDVFITEWQTTSDNETINIPTTGSGYNYFIDWGDGTFETGQTGNASHSYATAGTYQVKIFGDFPRIFFNNEGSKEQIQKVLQWGNIAWTSMERAFYGCSDLSIDATDAPDLSGATSMKSMFQDCTNLSSSTNNFSSWDVSQVTDMGFMFQDAGNFNEDIGNWNVSKVTTMIGMFVNANSFNQDIGNWIVSQVENMSGMFINASSFNEDIGNWNVSKVTTMSNMFNHASSFNQDISNWNVSQVVYMNGMFAGTGLSTINYDKLLIGWSSLPTLQNDVTFDAGNSIYCISAESRAILTNTYSWTINDLGQDPSCSDANAFITEWQTSSDNETITIPTNGNGYNYTIDWGDGMLETAQTGDASHSYATAGTYQVRIFGDFPRISFQNGGSKDQIQKVLQWGNIAWTSMEYSFWGCGNLSIDATDSPDLSMVDKMRYMFTDCGNLSSSTTNFNAWDVSNVSDMSYLFQNTGSFNQDISGWDVGQLIVMLSMFRDAESFNQDISGWDVSQVIDMRNVFRNATSFNQDISSWGVSQVTRMRFMFYNASSFDQDIGSWDVSQVTDMSLMFERAGLSTTNYDKLLIGWSSLPSLQNNVEFNAGSSQYCIGKEARAILIGTYNWTISDQGRASSCRGAFITEWQTSSDNESITIPTTGSGYNYSIDWGDGTIEIDLTGDASHTYATAGTYQVRIFGDFPRIYFNARGSRRIIQKVLQWGNIAWTSMENAFDGCSNLTIEATDKPDLSSVTSMQAMFQNCFNVSSSTNNFSSWDVSTVTDMSYMFYGASSFNQSIGNWDVSNVTDMSYMFWFNRNFNEDIGNWDVSNVTDMSGMFFDARSFNQDISNWDVSKVSTMRMMFREAINFNQDVGNWDVSNVTDMGGMFLNASSFNQDISNWDINKVTNMGGMFGGANSFIEDISNWDVSNVTNMANMFSRNTSFNQDISNWDVSNVTKLDHMFDYATSFNQDIGKWDLSKATTIRNMFRGATSFDQDIGKWDISQVTDVVGVFENAGLSTDNYDKLLIGWSSLPSLQSGRYFHAGSSQYCLGAEARAILTGTYGWTITDQGQDPSCSDANAFITEWRTSSDNESITIPTTGRRYNYSIDWGDGTIETGKTGNASHIYATAGTYQVKISGDFPRIFFSGAASYNKIYKVLQWGNIAWTSMSSAFSGCINLTIEATDKPDLSRVTSMDRMFQFCTKLSSSTNNFNTWDVSNVNYMTYMFYNASSFNEDIGNWDVGNVINMNSMFYYATSFNQDIGNWDVSQVINMFRMFSRASSFNQDIGNWDVSKVINMSYMFDGLSSFNQDIGNWNVSKVTGMMGIFTGASNFNQDIGNWNVSKVNRMDLMFNGASNFNQDIGNWSVSNVTSFQSMFNGANSFNQNIGNWDVSKATSMNNMFNGASSFDQDISNWDVSKVVLMENMFLNAGLSTAYYDKLLIGWSSLPALKNNVKFHAGSSQYCLGAAARAILIGTYGWTITDQGQASSCNQPPVAKCKDITVFADANCQYSANAEEFDGGSTDPDSDILTFSIDYIGLFPIGTTSVTLTVDDGSAKSTCSATINVVDNILPTVITQNITVQLDDSGQATFETGDVDNGSSDNCGVASMELDQSSFNCSDLGDNTVSLTVEDANGNKNSATAIVTVEDNIAPKISCQDLTISLQDGKASMPTSAILVTKTDNCGFRSVQTKMLNFDCSDLGKTIPVSYSVFDNAGNETSCTKNVKIEGEGAPTAVCKDLTVELDQHGMASITPAQVDNGSSDICGIKDWSLDRSNFTCQDVGQNIKVKLTVTSNNDNTAECDATIMVVDKILPDARCKDINIDIDEIGKKTLSVWDVDNKSYDACGIAELSLDKTTISCSDNEVTLTVKDNNGNENTCTAAIIVSGEVAPVPDLATLPVIRAECEATVFAPTATDNCGGTITATTNDPTYYSEQGRYEITWTYDDGKGNSISQTQTVIIKDVTHPVPDIEDLPLIAAKCFVTVSAPTATDNCAGTLIATTNDRTTFSEPGGYLIRWSYDDGNGNYYVQAQNVIIRNLAKPKPEVETLPDIIGECSVTVSSKPTARDECGSNIIEGTTTDPLTYTTVGTHIITWTYEDVDGNVETQTQNVIVNDVTKPVPDVATLPIVRGECEAAIVLAPTASDNCEGKILGTTTDPLTYSTQGTHIIIWSFDDGNGNVATQTQTVIVDDVTAPVPDLNSLPDITAECSVEVTQTPTATDNCEGTIIGTTTDPLSYSSQGTHIITWSYDDGNGNVETQTQTVIIKDVTSPVPDVTTLPTLNGNCEVGLEPPFATDNCAGQVIGSTSDPLYFDKEGTYTVTWVYDDGNGNTSSQDQTIIIEDDIAPVPDRDNLPTLRAQCGLTVSTKPTATDRCAGRIEGTTTDPLTYNTQGIHIITWTFDDGNGNTASQTQRVVIRDNKAPVPDQANLPTLTGSCSVMITHFPTATDNCAGKVTATTDSPLEFDQEGTYAILWNYDDGNGNTSVQTQWVIVGGDAAPNARCKDISVPLGSAEKISINASDIDDGSFDDCSSVTLLISPAGGTIFGTSLPPSPSMDIYCKDGKEQNLLLSVSNEKGNIAYCQAKVTLEGTDTDNDGILDSCDNCPDTYNPDQKDSNNNGTGDACEENSNPDPNPGGWGGWSLKKQGQEDMNIITELKAFPNPFQDEVNLSFNLGQEERTTVEIFNIQGQRVHTLLSELAPKGEHRVLWDGRDQNGQAMPAGIYLVRLRAGKALINQKVVLQR